MFNNFNVFVSTAISNFKSSMLAALLAALSLFLPGFTALAAQNVVINEAGTILEQMLGEITAIRKAVLSTNVSGRLIKTPYFTGDFVKAQTILANLDTKDFEIAVRQAQASLDSSKAKLQQMETGSRPEEKKQAAEQMRQAEANLKTALSDFNRMKGLYAAKMISTQAMEATEAKATASDAQFNAAKLQKSIVEQGPRAEEKESMRALMRQQEACLELARTQLEYTALKAPFDGFISARYADEGVLVSPSSPIYALVQLDPIYATLDCPEKNLPLLQKGTRAIITVDALPGKKFYGILERTPVIIDAITRTAKVEFTIENSEKILKPGMFARASVSLEAKSGGQNEHF